MVGEIEAVFKDTPHLAVAYDNLQISSVFFIWLIQYDTTLLVIVYEITGVDLTLSTERPMFYTDSGVKEVCLIFHIS